MNLPRRPQQHRVPMEVEVRPLPLGEPAHVDDALRLDPHAFERRQVRDRRDDQIPGVLEADDAPVEQVIDAGGKQQSVLPVEALVVPGVALPQAMAGDEVNGVGGNSRL